MKTITRDEFIILVEQWWREVAKDIEEARYSTNSAIIRFLKEQEFIQQESSLHPSTFRQGNVWVRSDESKRGSNLEKGEYLKPNTLHQYCKAYSQYGQVTIPTPKKKRKIQKRGRSHDVVEKKVLLPHEQIRYDRQISQAKEDKKRSEAKYKALLKQLDQAEAQVRTYEATDAIQEHNITVIEPKLSGGKSESAAFLCLSDWHLEEMVDPETVYGMNEYSVDIAHRRLFNTCQNALKVLRAQRHEEVIKTLIVWFGGDLITGYIHEELMEGNYLSPTEASMKAQEFMVMVLRFFIKHGEFDEIRVVCSPGNHGRTTKKIRVATGYKNSYEWMAFNNVARYMGREQGSTDLNWTIAKSLYTYIDVYGRKNRMWHGDNIRFQGGIGGVTIPLIKAVMRADANIRADYNFMAHFHTWIHPPKTTINGSLIGYGPYADRIGAPKEEPIQALQLLNNRYGYTAKFPIFAS